MHIIACVGCSDTNKGNPDGEEFFLADELLISLEHFHFIFTEISLTCHIV